MKAHVEFLSGIVRVGPITDAYGKDYEYSAAWASIDGKTAIIKALVSPDKMLTRVHAAYALAEVERRTGLKTTWDRAYLNPAGEIEMTQKHALAHPDASLKSDGSRDIDHIKAEFAKGLENIENGHEKLGTFTLEPSPAGGRRYTVDIDPV